MTTTGGSPLCAASRLFPRPPELAALHAALDDAVFAAYALPADLSDEQILERLLALNLQRAAA